MLEIKLTYFVTTEMELGEVRKAITNHDFL